MRLLSFAAVSFAAASFAAVAATVVGLLSAPAGAEEIESAKLGQKMSDVSLIDHTGKKATVHDLAGTKATVFVFLSYECPISTSYSTTLTEMAKRYGEKGVSFVGLCASEAETAESVERQAREFKLGFPVFHDPHGTNAGLFKAEKTPEAFVLDHNLVLRYRGRIDDSYRGPSQEESADQEPRPRKGARRNAGRQGRQPAGYRGRRLSDRRRAEDRARRRRHLLSRRRADPAESLPGMPSARTGGTVLAHDLPPGRQLVRRHQAVHGHRIRCRPGKSPKASPSATSGRMTDKEVSTLAAWVDGGTPEGNPSDAPSPREFVTGWRLGTARSGPFGESGFRRRSGRPGRLPLLRAADRSARRQIRRRLRSQAGQPARRASHAQLHRHWTARAEPSKSRPRPARSEPKSPATSTRGPGYSFAMGVGFAPRGGLGGWAPGQVPQPMPEGYGFKLPKKADVVVQVHYHRDGRVERDRLQIGLYFAKKTEGMKAYKTGMIAGRFLAIPPNDPHFKVLGSTTVKYDCVLHSIMPHMHLLGKKIKVTMKPPGGKKQTLLEIDSWDYNWQETYFLEEAAPAHGRHGSRPRGGLRQQRGQSQQPEQPAAARHLRRADDQRNVLRLPGLNLGRPGPQPVRRPLRRLASPPPRGSAEDGETTFCEEGGQRQGRARFGDLIDPGPTSRAQRCAGSCISS